MLKLMKKTAWIAGLLIALPLAAQNPPAQENPPTQNPPAQHAYPGGAPHGNA